MIYLKLIRWQNTFFMMVLLSMMFLLWNHEINLVQSLYIIGVGLIFSAGNLVNDLYDVRVDQINNGFSLVSQLSKRKLWGVYLSLNALSLIISPNYSTALIFVISIFLLWLYSAVLKSMVVAGNMIIAILTFVSVYWTKNLGLDSLDVTLFSGMCGILQFIREVIKDIEDIKGDNFVGTRTLPIVLGVNQTKLFIYIFTSLFCLVIVYVDWFVKTEKHIWPLYGVVYMLLVFMVKLSRAGHITQYHFLSSLLKLTMVVGSVSLFFFK